MDFRFNAHDARTGDYLFALPRPAKAQIGDVFGERGTLELTYSTRQARALDLPTFVEVRAQVQYDGGEWQDVGPALIRLGGSHEDTDASGMRTVTLVGREWLLGRARVSAGDTSVELIDGKRPFYQASAGEIMRTLLLEAKDRGAASGIDLGGFTATQDTAGNTWSERVTIYYSPGLPIGDVLQNLVDQGLCDYRMVGRTLELYEPETTLGRDLTTGNDPVRVHGAVTEAPVSYTLEDIANSALLIGDDGFEVEVDNPSAPDDYGRLEVTIEQGGVSSEGTARTLIDAELQRGSREIREITRTQHAAGAKALPYRDYRAGDFVQVYDQGEWRRYRVREIQLVREDGGWTVHTVLNDRLQELLLRLAKKQNGIVNGSRGSGGDGTRPTPPPKPGVEPAAPQGLVVDQQVYLDVSGTARGVVTAGWGEVTESTRGLAIDIGGYELWWRVNDTFAVWTRAAVTSGDTEVSHSPVVLEDGDGQPMEYQWQVRAVARESNRPGPFSSIVTLTMTQDTTPPPVPSAPIVETGFRIVTVEWDGLDEIGQEMPRDFAWVRIYTAATEDMVGATLAGSLGHPGSWNSETMPADVPVWVTLTAVDRSGNESPMTTPVSVTPRQLVDDEAIQDEIGRIDDTIQDAVDDLQQEIDGIVIDATGTKNFYQAEPPAADDDPAPAEGDLWFDQNDQNKPYIFRDGEWVSVRDDSFLSTAKNLMPWGDTGDPHALAGQTFTIPSAEMRVQAGLFPGFPTFEGLGILIGDGENRPASRAITRLPFQGAFDASNSLRRDSTAVPYEGRPLGVSAQVLFNSSSGTPVVRVYATFYDVEGNALRSESASVNARPLDPNDLYEGVYRGYGMTHIVALERVLELQESLRADAVSFAMHVELSIPRVAGSAAMILALEARVQVPEGGIAANAITETKIAPNSIATPHLKAEVVTAEKIAAGTITADSGIIGSLDAGKITVGEMDGARIKAGSIQADLVLIEGSVGSTLIQDGAITTDKILAEAITAGKIAALAVEAGHIAANAVTADTIAGGAIDGKVITGATIRTAASGSRVQMNTQGFYAYNPSNVETFSINGNTGAVNITGNLTQENSYGDLRVGPAIYNASGEGDATPAVALRRTGSTYYGVAGVALTGGSGSEHLVVQGPLAGAGQGSWVVLPQAGYGSAGITRSFAVGDTSFFRLNTAGDARMEARTGPYVGAFAGGYANLSNGDGTYFQAASGNNAHVEAAGGGVYLRSKLNASADYSRAHITLSDTGSITLRTQQTASSNVRGGYIHLNTDGVGVYAGAGASGVAARNLWLRAYGNAYLAAYSTGANASAQAYVDLLASGTTYWQGSRMYISTLPASSGAVPIGRVSGQLHSVSSSRKYKLLEEPIDARDSNLEDKLLSIPVKTWVDRTAAERLAAHHTAVHNGEDPEDDLVGCGTLERFPGVVAEDLHDAGLNMFVGYEDGEPEWVLYDRIGPALIPIIKRLRDRVDALETQIGATP